MLFDTGARLGEFLSMKVEDIDLVKMRAMIKTEKSKMVKILFEPVCVVSAGVFSVGI